MVNWEMTTALWDAGRLQLFGRMGDDYSIMADWEITVLWETDDYSSMGDWGMVMFNSVTRTAGKLELYKYNVIMVP